MRKIVLASKSPRRKELLENIGLKFECVDANLDESIVPTELEPKMYVQQLAMLKASAASKDLKRNSLVIGADTVVVKDGKILGKPKDYDDALKMLNLLSNSNHEVYTGIAVCDRKTMKIISDYQKTVVHFRKLNDDEIKYYLDVYKPFDKAGAYGIQEFAGVFADRIEGDYFNIVGLPVCKLYTLITREFEEEIL